MRHFLILLAAALSLSACAGKSFNTDRSELANARAAIDAARAADAERCAPKTMADAVGNLYWAAHELAEGMHVTETAELIARTEEKGKEAEREAKENCKPKPKPKPKVVEIISLKGVNFEHDSAKLTASSTVTLDEAIATLQRRSDIHVEVAAHTDSQGSDDYNMGLSERRAASVMEYLTSHGVDAGRLTAKGYGESQPIADNKTKEGRAENRRVELRVMK